MQFVTKFYIRLKKYAITKLTLHSMRRVRVGIAKPLVENLTWIVSEQKWSQQAMVGNRIELSNRLLLNFTSRKAIGTKSVIVDQFETRISEYYMKT